MVRKAKAFPFVLLLLSLFMLCSLIPYSSASALGETHHPGYYDGLKCADGELIVVFDNRATLEDVYSMAEDFDASVLEILSFNDQSKKVVISYDADLDIDEVLGLYSSHRFVISVNISPVVDMHDVTKLAPGIDYVKGQLEVFFIAGVTKEQVHQVAASCNADAHQVKMRHYPPFDERYYALFTFDEDRYSLAKMIDLLNRDPLVWFVEINGIYTYGPVVIEPDDPLDPVYQLDPIDLHSPANSHDPIDYNRCSVLDHFGEWNPSSPAASARLDIEFSSDMLEQGAFELRLGSRYGELIDPSFITMSSGSTVITLSNAYLATLPPGVHSFTALFPTYARTGSILLIVEPVGSPLPGINDNLSSLALIGPLLMLFIVTLTTVFLALKRRKHNAIESQD